MSSVRSIGPWCMMSSALLAFIAALGASLVLTFGVRTWSIRVGLVDRPDGERKLHDHAVALGGGVAIFLAVAVAVTAGLLSGAAGFDRLLESPAEVLGLGVAATVIFLLGFVDDVLGLRAWTKFLIQVVVTLGLFALGVRIETIAFGDWMVQLPDWLSLLGTVVWVVGITNAFNLIDGSDGVAGGAALFALLTFAAVALLVGHPYGATLALILAGATLGFLFFNFPPASIYLGDAGSLFLGFSLAALSIVATQKASTLVAVAVPLLSFGVPILDTSLAIARRILRGQPVFRPDRGHIHHRLKDMGYSPRSVALGVWALSALFGLTSMVLVGGTAATVAGVLVVAGLVTVVFIQRLRIPEILALGRVLRKGVDQGSFIRIRLETQELSAQLLDVERPAEALDLVEALFDRGEICAFELWVRDPEGRALLGVEDVVEAGEGHLVRRRLSEPEDGWSSRFPLTLPEGRIGFLTLEHSPDYSGARMDLRVIRHELVPALMSVLARAGRSVARSTDPEQPDRPARAS